MTLRYLKRTEILSNKRHIIVMMSYVPVEIKKIKKTICNVTSLADRWRSHIFYIVSCVYYNNTVKLRYNESSSDRKILRYSY